MYRHLVTDKIVSSLHSLWTSSGGGRWLVALSGGADSTALLTACRKASVPVVAVHCNFNLRGEESLRDRDFVINLCKEADVELHVEEFNVSGEAQKGESMEMTCRRIRYDLFHRLMIEKGCGRIAVAHNADDNAETLMLNLLRGSGSAGLAGMKPDNGTVIRPLLEFGRKDILKFLDESRQPYIVDSSNLTSDFRRNFIRNEVFPLLASRWEGYSQAIRNTQRILRKENSIVEHFIASALKPYSDFLPWDAIRNFPDAETLIFRFIEKFGGSPSIAGEIARHSLSPSPGKIWNLRNGHTARSTKNGLEIRWQKS